MHIKPYDIVVPVFLIGTGFLLLLVAVISMFMGTETAAVIMIYIGAGLVIALGFKSRQIALSQFRGKEKRGRRRG